MLKLAGKMIAPALVLSMAVAARADDAAASPKPFVRVAVVSADRVKQAATDLGIPLPMDPVTMIEGQFQFIGDKGLDTSKPIGIIYFAGEGLTPQQATAFAFPVNAGKGTVENLTALGGTLAPGEADIVELGKELSFHRTADYLMMASATPLVKLLPNNPFDGEFKNKETIVRLEIDAATARAAAPKMYKEFVDSMRAKGKEGPAPASAAEARGQEIGRNMVYAYVEKLEKLSLALNVGTDKIRIATAVSPSPMKGSREFPKPVFAPGAVATMHIAYPDAESTQWFANAMMIGLDADQAGKADALTPEQIAKLKPIAQSAGAALIGDAQSMSVVTHDGHFVLTLVNQYDRDINLPAELKKDLAALKDIDPSSDNGSVEDYTGPNGATGLRFHSGKKDGGPATILITQTGKLAVITISDTDTGPSDVTLSPTEKISDLMVLHLDLGAALKAANEKDGGPLAMLPDEKRKLLQDKLTGKEMTLTLKNTKSGALAVDLDIPVELVKMAAETMLAK